MKYYTDGSFSKVGDVRYGAWAAVYEGGVVASGNIVSKAPNVTNIFAETSAVLKLLEKIYKYECYRPESIIDIYTDSLTTIQKISMYKKDIYADDGSHKNMLEIVKLISNIENMGYVVNFHKIKGHANSLGNNFADYVASSLMRNSKNI